MSNPVELWTEIAKGKIKNAVDTFRSCENLLVYKESGDAKKRELYNQISNNFLNQINAIASHFAPKSLPIITGIQNNWSIFQGDSSKYELFKEVAFKISELLQILDDEQPTVSFDKIFEEFKKDEKLNELLDKLSEILKRIIEEGSEQINAKMATELQKLLDYLLNRNNLSLQEIDIWAEITGKFLIMVIKALGGGIIVDLAKDAIQIIHSMKTRLMEGHKEAQVKAIEQAGFSRYVLAPNKILKVLPQPDSIDKSVFDLLA